MFDVLHECEELRLVMCVTLFVIPNTEQEVWEKKHMMQRAWL